MKHILIVEDDNLLNKTVPDSAYALFTEKELEKIYEERDIFHERLMHMIDSF